MGGNITCSVNSIVKNLSLNLYKEKYQPSSDIKCSRINCAWWRWNLL